MSIEQKIDELVAALQHSTDTMERLVATLGGDSATASAAQQQAAATGVPLSAGKPNKPKTAAEQQGDAFSGLGGLAQTATEAAAVKQNEVIEALLEVGKRFGRNGIVDVLARFDASTAMDPKLEGRYDEVMAAINDKLAE